MEPLTWEKVQALKAAGNLHPLRVVSGSMAPLIPIGATVVVDPARTPRRWDVVVYWDGQKLICHVLWHVNRHALPNEALLLAPLVGRSVDLAVPRERVLGVVVSHRLTWFWRLRMLWGRR